jgi:hypothetical protein
MNHFCDQYCRYHLIYEYVLMKIDLVKKGNNFSSQRSGGEKVLGLIIRIR